MTRRILIKGASGAGKSTLARELARRLGLPFVELDALHHGPDWTAASAAELQGKVLETLDDSRGWVVDGNYDGKLGNTVADRAELIIWLDLTLPTKLWRLARRSAGRLLRREELWNGNHETLCDVTWGEDALLVLAVRMHFRHRRLWPAQFAGRPLIRLRSREEVDRWLSDFCSDELTKP